MTSRVQPHWQLPPGVTRGVQEYARASYIAEDYDDLFAFNRLFVLDSQVLGRCLPPGGLVLDLGCGTGRALLPLLCRGSHGLAVDLSEHMLQRVRQKTEHLRPRPQCVRANMVQLDWLKDDSVDGVICLFSTLGMVRGAANRLRALIHIRRVLKPGGVFVLHVHNFWYNSFFPDGFCWVLLSLARATLRRDVERGDKFFTYRRIPRMFLHTFTRRELVRSVRRAGFEIREMIALDAKRTGPLPWPWLCGSLRANGWIVVSG